MLGCETKKILLMFYLPYEAVLHSLSGDVIALYGTSVADPGCLSRIPDPDFYPSRIPDLGSRIPDPKTATKERSEKKFFVIPFYVATNFTKL